MSYGTNIGVPLDYKCFIRKGEHLWRSFQGTLASPPDKSGGYA